MGEITIVKEFSWSMAHMLANHKGKCKNIHGHTYKMEVELKRNGEINLIDAPGTTEHGMVMEFDDVKTIIKETIVDLLDHAFLYWNDSTDDLEHDIARLLIKHERKVININYRPTAENLAKDFLEKLQNEFLPYSLNVVSVKLWESPSSFAKVKA